MENQFLIKGIAEFIPLKNAQTYGEEKKIYLLKCGVWSKKKETFAVNFKYVTYLMSPNLIRFSVSSSLYLDTLMKGILLKIENKGFI